MSGLDFFVDLAVTGTVLGLDHTSDVATVRSVFGEPGQAISARSMLIDTGLVEFGWGREGAHQNWSVTYFGTQAHRLPRLTASGRIGSALVEHYGEFPPRLDVDELRAAVTVRGGTLEERPTVNAGYVDLWSPVSRISVLAAMDPAATGEPAGTVVKMLGPVRQPLPGKEKAFASYATHLLSATAAGRTAWLDERDPVDRPERRDWWRCLHAAVANRAGADAAGRRLRLDLLHEAAVRGVDPPAETAAAEVELMVAAGTPVDDAVRRWLDAVPVPLAAATGQDVPVARALRDQLHRLAAALPRVADPAVAERLAPWLAVQPLLLAPIGRGRLSARSGTLAVDRI